MRSKICGKVTTGYLTTRKMRPQSRAEPGEMFSQAQEFGQGYVLLSNWRLGTQKMIVVPAPTSQLPDEREFAVDSGSSMHLLSKKNLS